MHLIELKFSMYIKGHCPTYFIDFGEFKINCKSTKNPYTFQSTEANYRKYASI